MMPDGRERSRSRWGVVAHGLSCFFRFCFSPACRFARVEDGIGRPQWPVSGTLTGQAGNPHCPVPCPAPYVLVVRPSCIVLLYVLCRQGPITSGSECEPVGGQPALGRSWNRGGMPPPGYATLEIPNGTLGDAPYLREK